MDDEMTGDPGTDASGRERSGRLTTMIPRPANRRASDAGRSRLGDLRRRGPKADRISGSRRSAWLFGLAALVIAGAIGAALFGLPVRTWFDQDDQISALEHELNELQDVNQDLEDEVGRLLTDTGIREAAREELGQMEIGDNRQTMGAMPDLPRELPAGWPYSQVGQIIQLRVNEAATQTAAADAAQSPTPAEETPAADGTPGVGGFQPLVPQLPAAETTAAPALAVAADLAPTTVAPAAAPTTVVTTTVPPG